MDMPKIALLLLSFCSLLIFTESYSQNNPWEVAKNKDGIIVYTRETDASSIREFKAVTSIKASLKEVITILNKVEDYPNWMANCQHSKIVKKISDNERIDYMQSAVPWPLDNRDVVTRYKSEVDYEKGYYLATTTSEPTLVEPVEGFVRLNKGLGSWKLEREGEVINVTYKYNGDPEISIPKWIINMFIVDSPFETLTNLREKLE